jgi:hypothetical protein
VGPRGRAGERRAAGTASMGPALAGRTHTAPSGLAAAFARAALTRRSPSHRGAERAAPRHTPPLPAHATPPPQPAQSQRAAAPEPAARRGLAGARNFPGSQRSVPPDLPCHNRRHLPQTLAKTPTLARFPPMLSLVPLPRPFSFSSLLDSTQPPRSFSPRSRHGERDASRRLRSRGSCSQPSLETYPSDGACAGGSSAGKPSVWSMGSAPVIRVLGRALRDLRGD